MTSISDSSLFQLLLFLKVCRPLPMLSQCQLLLLLLSHFSRPTLCDSIDGSPPGSPIPGILQARTLEWVAISFCNAWKWNMKVKSLSRVRPSATPWTAAFQAPPSMGFSRQEYCSGVPLPSLVNVNYRVLIGCTCHSQSRSLFFVYFGFLYLQVSSVSNFLPDTRGQRWSLI